ncbi:MAG: hypothetical protein K2I10_05655 [Lachnospiraceae bacterium]|nr:hypothetical protein [Lachnospiraceae bacterium]
MEMCYDGALVMPSSYAVMSEDEMTYVEGGASKFLSKGKCIDALVAIGINSPQLAIAGALTYTLAKCLIRKISTIAGLAAKVVTFILTWAAGQVVAFGVALARGALNRGVTVGWNWNPFRDPIGVTASVKY